MKIYINMLLIMMLPILLLAEVDSSKRATVKQLFNINIVKVTKLKSANKKKYYGYIVANQASIYDISPRYSGYIERLYADTLYAKVKKGDRLALIYSPEVLQAKEDYINSLNFNSSRSSGAMRESSRLKLELLGIPKNEITNSKRSHYTTIFAPKSGWIFEKSINGGSSFRKGERLFQIINLDSVWVEAKIYQDDISLLDRMDTFDIQTTASNRSYRAKKLLLYPNLDPKDATATLRLEIDNSDGKLILGNYTTIAASTSRVDRVVIPRKAAIRKDGKWYAFLATEFEGEYDPVEIEIEPLDRDHYEVLSGLNEGEEIVDNALFMMDSDTQINGLY